LESSRRIEAVIFDLDNTFVDFVEAKIKACEVVVKITRKSSWKV